MDEIGRCEAAFYVCFQENRLDFSILQLLEFSSNSDLCISYWVG